MAELSGLPAPRMDWSSSDPAQAFRRFRTLCDLMFEGPLQDKSEETKVKYLLIWSGEEGIELSTTWNLTVEEKKKLLPHYTRFETYVAPKSNFRLARFKLRMLKQAPSETVDSFIKRARVLVQECKYIGANDHLLDTLIYGTNSSRVQSRLIQGDETMTLEHAIDIARTEETTRNQLDDIAGKEIHQVKKKTSQYQPKSSQRKENPQHKQQEKQHPQYKQQQEKECRYCAKRHNTTERSNCPAFGTKCTKCGKRNHWAKVCRGSQKSFHTVETDEQCPQSLFFGTVQISSIKAESQAIAKLHVRSAENDRHIDCKLDTGAEGNMLPLGIFKQLFPRSGTASLTPSSTTLTAYGGSTVKNYGTCIVRVKHKDIEEQSEFHVVEVGGPALLGLPTCRALKLVSLHYAVTTPLTPPTQEAKHSGNQQEKKKILEEYADCFKGVGCFPGEYKITVDPKVPAVIHPPRRVPVALQEPLRIELENLTQQGIIAKVERPTDWVNSCVCVTKPNGSIRLCLDPKDLNKAIKRPHHVTPTLDDVLPKLNGAKFFSILDARSGYWNIKLTDDSSYLTTFNTPHGRYRFLRLPFGLNCAQDIFQRMVDATFHDLPGVTGIADDIVVVGYKSDGSDHDKHLKAVLQRARDSGLRFNPDKLKVKCDKIPFFGNIIGADGLHPDPAKVQAILTMNPPSDVKELQTFLGTVTYLSRYTANLSQLSAPLRDLCKKDSEFIWGPEHQQAFDQLKKTFTSPPTLQYFDGTKDVKIQVDASLRGLGAALLQDKGPVEYASKSLSEIETRYSNIEREMLAVLFGLERFHHYAYGRKVTIITDHKPLVAIFSKNLCNAPPRIARMLLRIHKYDIKLQYEPGKSIQLADALSRINPCEGEEIKGLNITVHEININVNASPTRIDDIQRETAKDPILQVLAETINKGWPETRSSCPTVIADFWNYRDELCVENGMILKGTNKLVIPKSLQQEVLSQIHYAHLGIEKCRLRARTSVFWVGINSDIEQMVKGCESCQTYKPENQKEPLMPHEVPPHPWHTVGTDLFYLDGITYLLIGDYYSKFPVVRKLNNTSTSLVIEHLKQIFSEQGIPSKIISDNGPQYAAEEFKMFCKKWNIEHVTSSPLYPQSNGYIERTVQTVKNILKKARQGEDPHMALLCLRTTPVTAKLPPPCALLNNRMYKNNMPSVSKPHDTGVNDELYSRQQNQKYYFDQKAKELSDLLPDQTVRVYDRHNKQWQLGKVVSRAETPRSYHVQTSKGGRYRRNRRHLSTTGEKAPFPSFPENPIPDDIEPEVSTQVTPGSNNNPREPVAQPSPRHTMPPPRRSNRTVHPPKHLEVYEH